MCIGIRGVGCDVLDSSDEGLASADGETSDVMVNNSVSLAILLVLNGKSG